MDWTLEVIVVPVSDVDRAKEFYSDKLGFHVDIDTHVTKEIRIIQLTPPGSGCSIVIGEGIPTPGGRAPEPGSYVGLQLVVADIKAAHAELVERGVGVSDPIEVAPGDGGTFLYFEDPDGNAWAVQEYRVRATRPLYEVLRPKDS
ncbi:VOC family protein [Streptomyces lunaelactis]|uniref:VOC family protein n=1 Tax=Streptomyces lunaelactis TaxID=1535768 RepID=UPI0015859114|nr:VOC family protein [Streptomyces lunaelactis]NUK18191.1 VOC family protein [Streptomyces lunaelactis]